MSIGIGGRQAALLCQRQRQNPQIVPVDPVELGQGKGVLSPAHLDGVSGPVVTEDEPILVSRKARGVGHVLQGVAGGGGEGLSQGPGAGGLQILVLPVDDLPLAVVGQGPGRGEPPGQVRHGLRLRLAEGPHPHKVPGGRSVKALSVFDLPGPLPPGGIVQVQIHPPAVGFPPVGERDGRKVPGNGRRPGQIHCFLRGGRLLDR